MRWDGGGACSHITLTFCSKIALVEKSFLSAMLMGKVSHISLFLILFRGEDLVFTVYYMSVIFLSF